MMRTQLRPSPATSSPAAATPRELLVSKIDTGAGVVAIFRIELPSADAVHALTDAEREVVTALLDHCSNADIARQRGTSLRTVANQVASVFRKLGVRSRSELVGTGALFGANRER